MKLIVSFDTTNLEKSLEIAQTIAHYADILKIDTPLIYKYGVGAIKKFQTHFPKHVLIADAKIINYTQETIPLFAHAGAHWITVMAGTNNNTIHHACMLAHNLNVKIMLDLTDSISVAQSALDAQNLGVDALYFNHPYDDTQEPFNFHDKWETIHGNTDLPIFVAANISMSNIDHILRLNPAGIIVGTNITHTEHPVQAAHAFYEKVKSVPKL